MKTDIELGLQGAFKVDLYSGGKFVETTDWFSNFITPTGLYYPNIYPFVDCFRFLTLGDDTSTPNSGAGYPGSEAQGLGTTGLADPIITFGTSLGNQAGTYIGWPGYENGINGFTNSSSSSQSACGTLFTEQGPRFYRAWAIPTGGVNYNINNGEAGLVINEFMVSPSSGSDPTGRYAFSRVRRTITIPNGYSAIISYQLSINIQNTGLTFFGPGTFTTGNADVTSEDDDYLLVNGWANLSGYYRQVYHGLNFVNSAGAHDTLPWGCGMEPSITDLSNYCFYLSPDNSAFDISKTGAVTTNSTEAYNADGLMGSLFGIPSPTVPIGQTLTDDIFYGLVPFANNGLSSYDTTPYIPYNIRIGKRNLIEVPSVTNYASGEAFTFSYQETNDATLYDISYATPGSQLVNPNKVNFQQKAVLSTRIFKLPMDFNTNDQNLITGRTKTITRKTLFSPVSSLGYNTRFASLVFASNLDPQDNAGSTFYPMVDTLFFNASGRSLMAHYRLLDVVLDERGSGVADSYINIISSGYSPTQNLDNVNRFYSRQTFQGPYDINDGNPYGFDLINSHMQGGGNEIYTPSNQIVSVPLSGSGHSNNLLGEALMTAINRDGSYASYNSSGWGMVYGVVADDDTYYNQNIDCGIIDHNITGTTNTLSLTPRPVVTDRVYWPDLQTPLILSITGVRYFSTGTCWTSQGAGSVPLSSGAGSYDWGTNLCQFCPPTGHIEHHEHIGGVGYRLLPNHGIPNNDSLNIYSPLMGGAYPGLSFDNGIELYFNISWNSPCPPGIPNCQ
jgi:hypothetical protein